jgi:hypothetical protein
MWKFLGLFVILGIGVPVLMMIYQGFVNSTNGSWNNWTVTTATGCVTAYSTFEHGVFQIIPLLAGLMALGFILFLIAGGFQKKEGIE